MRIPQRICATSLTNACVSEAQFNSWKLLSQRLTWGPYFSPWESLIQWIDWQCSSTNFVQMLRPLSMHLGVLEQPCLSSLWCFLGFQRLLRFYYPAHPLLYLSRPLVADAFLSNLPSLLINFECFIRTL